MVRSRDGLIGCCNYVALLILLFPFASGKPSQFADFRFVAEPKHTVVIKGNSAILDCSASGDPPPLIKWKRDGADLLFSDDRRRILENGSLYFDKVYHTRTERPDEGLYQCSATREGLGTIVSRPAKLQIASLPKFDAQPNDLTLFPGQTAYFPCSVRAIPPASIMWLRDEHPFQFDDSRMTVLPSGALEIDHVQKSDSASYRCNASNIEKFHLSEPATLTVNWKFDGSTHPTSPYFIATPPKSSVVVEGDSLTLDCVANGNPKPIITWLKNGVTIDLAHLDSRFQIIGSGSLHIEKVKEDDAGSYVCRAVNNEDSEDALANVDVHVPPRFVKEPRNRYTYEKSDTVLECEVYGIPKPTVQWLRDGNPIIQSEYYQYVKLHSLRILGVVNSDAGIYQCVASNPTGYIQSPMQLLIISNADSALITSTSTSTIAYFHETTAAFNSKDTPSAPRNLSAIITATRFITLKWNPPLRTNGEISVYSVYYRELSSSRERVINTTSNRLEEINIQGLQPSTTYVFRVVAYNKNGPGQSSDNFTVVTASEVKVPSLPLKLEAVPHSATSIFVRWHPPGEGSEPVHRYTVYYMEDGILEEHEATTADTSLMLTGLRKFTEYTIWVTATNNLGVGQSTKEVSVRTYSDVPSDTPQNVTLEPASSSSIIVRWEPPPKEAQNGIISGYKIRYKMKNRRASTVTTDGNRRLFALTNLERGAQYSVKISALTVNGSGPATDWMSAETYQNDLNESRVPDQPGSLRLRPSSTSVYVTWTAPRNQNIMIRGYTIGWGVGIPDVYTKVLDGKQRDYKIENLNPSSEYVVSLRAYNQIGDGIPIYDSVKTLIETTPEPLSPMLPPVGLKAIVLSATTVVLYWSDTSLSSNQIVTDNRYYVVRYFSNKYKYFNSTELNCMINDLKPNTQYEFSVKVVKGRRESTWSMSVLNTTHEAVPSSPPRDLTVVPSEDESTVVNLHWQPPKQPNGQITGYVISYSSVPPQKNLAVEDRKWVLEDSVGDRMIAVLKGLSLDTTYFFKIQAKNSKGYGPFSSEISFHTPPESKALSSNMLYVIIACVSGGTLLILLIVIVIVCRKRQRFLSSKRSKSYAKSTLAKNKALAKELVPPDLWIHHDQMELKPVDKTSCAENNMTVTPIQRNSQELGEEPLLSCMEKKKSAYLDPLEDTSTLANKCIVKCQIRATPIKIPLDVQKPLLSSNTSAVTLPSASTSQICDAGGSTMGRPMYPRTQYNIPRTHNSGEICHAGSTADVAVPLPINVHAAGPPYEPVISTVTVEKCQAYPTISAVPTAEHSSGTLTKRLPGHPLRSFTVPAPPPQSAPATPQPKHLDTCLPKSTMHHPGMQPSSSSVAHSHAVAAQSSAPKSETATKPNPDTVHVSWSTEKLNQEVANLEGLMKDLNAMRASEFEC